VINIFFVPGMFGSSIESVLRRSADPTRQFKIANDGSMHTFKKWIHPENLDHIDQMMQRSDNEFVTTPLYPTVDGELVDICQRMKKYEDQDTKNVLVYAKSVEDAEINILFQYYKIVIGLDLGLGILCQGANHNIVNWNSNYVHWSQMQHWEFREWFSLYYPGWSQKWIDSEHQVESSFLKIRNTDLLANPLVEFRKIINFSNLTEFEGFESFTQEWKKAQQYIVDECNLLNDIIYNTINNLSFSWNDLNIVSESIIQKRLRANGYEIRCDGLNKFPTDSETLYNLLEKV